MNIKELLGIEENESSGDFSPLWCGQNTSGCKDIPAAALLSELAQGLG